MEILAFVRQDVSSNSSLVQDTVGGGGECAAPAGISYIHNKMSAAQQYA